MFSLLGIEYFIKIIIIIIITSKTHRERTEGVEYREENQPETKENGQY